MARGKSNSSDDVSLSHRGSNFSLASSNNMADYVNLIYYPDCLEVGNAGYFSGAYYKINFQANGAPRYRSDFVDSIGDHYFIYKNEDGGWCFAVGEHQVLMNGGSYKTRHPAKQPHLHSASWMQCCVTYKNQNSQGDPYWVGYPQMTIKDVTDTHADEEVEEGIGPSDGTLMVATKRLNEAGKERGGDGYDDEEYDEAGNYGGASISSSSAMSNINGLARILREQRHAEESKFHDSVGRTAPGTPVVDLLVEAGLAYSIADARRCIRLRKAYIDEELVEELDELWLDTAYGDYIIEVVDRGRAVVEIIRDIPVEPDWAIASRNFKFKKPTLKQQVDRRREVGPKSAALAKLEEEAKNGRRLDESGDVW